MKKKVILMLITTILALSVVMITGCKKEDESKADQPAKQELITLKWPTIWVGEDSKAPMIAALVDEFNAMNEGRYKVEIEANPDYDAYRNKLNSQIAAGVVPDLFVLNPDPTSLSFYEGDLLMDFAEELSGSWGDNFVSGAISGATIDGALKSIPYEVGYTPVWYNMDIFKAAGIPDIPKTYDEFFDACEKIKAAGFIPTSQMTGGTNAWTSMLWFSHIAASIGGPDVWEKDITDPVFVQAAEILRMMYIDGNTSKDAVGGDAGVSGGHFLAGRSAMFINGPWYIGRVKNDAPDVFKATKIGPAPAVEGGFEGAQIGFPQSNLAAGATDDPAKKEAVIAFMKWMTLPENVKKISMDAGSMFAVKFGVDDGEDVDLVQGQFMNAVNDSAFVNTHFQANFATDVVAEFGQALARMALGKATAEEFIQQIADKID
ncbi:MAG: ABC transporter substrate-binding protein [Spirochaetales bacterium]|uniref:ABC transporter substrate-binding protein n=1 Tax=Candidatus Thalassospirochaeta sargassi TaxID=3119039 RepID=A0AAJ1MMK9_9SPIO|nr:ABC transporter substrate-binding protein [Spirochaetales bacterium]